MSQPLDVLRVHRLDLRSHAGFWLTLDVGTANHRAALIRGEPPDGGVRAQVFRRGRRGDLVGTTYASCLAISGQMRDTLTAMGLTGWGSVPWDLGDAWNDPLWLLTVTGSCGPKFNGVHGGPAWLPLGQFLDPGRWDGSDIFMPDNVNRS